VADNEVDGLRVKIEADADQAVKETGKVTGAFDKVKQGVQNTVNVVNSLLGSTGRALENFAGKSDAVAQTLRSSGDQARLTASQYQELSLALKLVGVEYDKVYKGAKALEMVRRADVANVKIAEAEARAYKAIADEQRGAALDATANSNRQRAASQSRIADLNRQNREYQALNDRERENLRIQLQRDQLERSGINTRIANMRLQGAEERSAERARQSALVNEQRLVDQLTAAYARNNQIRRQFPTAQVSGGPQMAGGIRLPSSTGLRGRDPLVQTGGGFAGFDARAQATARAAAQARSAALAEEQRQMDEYLQQYRQNRKMREQIQEEQRREQEQVRRVQDASRERQAQVVATVGGYAPQGTQGAFALVAGIMSKNPVGIVAGVLSSVQDVFNNVTGLIGKMIGIVTTGVQTVGNVLGGIGGFFKGVLDSIGQAVTGFTSFFGEIAKGALTLGLAYVGFKAIEEIIQKTFQTMIGFNASLEMAGKSWSVMLGSAESPALAHSEQLLAAIQNQAIKTAFSFNEAERGVRQLMQGGISLGQIFSGGLLEATQNVAASMGSNMVGSFERLTYALGQIQAAGRLTGQEMRQLFNAGVNIPELFAVMSKQTGISTQELYKMQEAQKITSSMFMRAFIEWSKTNFGGLAAEQAKTFTGAIQQIQEVLTVFVSRAGKPLFDRISAMVQGLAETLTSGDFQQMAGRISGIVDGILNALGFLASGFQGAFDRILQLVSTGGQAIYQALQWINPFARHSPSLVESVEDGVQRILDAYGNLSREIPEILGVAQGAITAFREATGGGLERIESAQFAELSKALNLISPEAPRIIRDLQAGIKGLRDEAAALTPEIVLYTQHVRFLNDIHVQATRDLDALKREYRDFLDTIKPLDAEIQTLQNTIAVLDLRIGEEEAALRAARMELRPLEEDVRRHSESVDRAQLVYREWDLRVREASFGLVDLKNAVENANDFLTRQQETLTRSRDRLSELKDGLSDLKDRMSDLMDTPLEGEEKLNLALLKQKAVVTQLNAEYLRAKANQAPEARLKGMQQRLDFARSQLEALRAEKELKIDLPNEMVEQAARAGGKEISFEAKIAGVTGLRGQITQAESLVAAQEKIVNGHKQVVIEATSLRDRARETLHAEEQRVDQLIKGRTEAALQVEQAELLRERAELVLKLAEDRLRPQEESLRLLKAEKEELSQQLNLVELRRTVALQDGQELLDQIARQERYREDVNTQLQDAKQGLSDLKTLQGDLVSLANAWNREMDEAISKAEQYAALLKRKEKEAGDPNTTGSDNNRKGGLEEALANSKAFLDQLAVNFTTGQKQAGAFVTEFQTRFAPLIGFFGRLQGLASGMADTLDTLFKRGLSDALWVAFQTIQDVLHGLPEALNEWTTAFVTWVGDMAWKVTIGLKDFATKVLTWINGEAATEFEGGLSTWANTFVDWVLPALAETKEKLALSGQQIESWITEQWPVFKESLITWKDQFVGWVAPIWEELSKELNALWEEHLYPWLVYAGGEIWESLTNPTTGWVPKMVNWAKGLWETPEGGSTGVHTSVDRLVANLITWAEDPNGGGRLYNAGVKIGEWIWGGFASVTGQLPGRIAAVLASSITKGVIQTNLKGDVWINGEAIANWMLGGWIGAATGWPAKIGGAISEALLAAANSLAGFVANIGTSLATGLKDGFTNAIRGGDPSQIQRGIETQLRADYTRQQAYLAGSSTGEGFRLGLEDQQAATIDATRLFLQGVIRTSEEELQAKSPSEVYIRLGQSVGEGFALGIDSEHDSVLRSGQLLGDALGTGLEGALPRVNQAVDTLNGAVERLGVSERGVGKPGEGPAAGGGPGITMSRAKPGEDPAHLRWLSLFGPQAQAPTSQAPHMATLMADWQSKTPGHLNYGTPYWAGVGNPPTYQGFRPPQYVGASAGAAFGTQNLWNPVPTGDHGGAASAPNVEYRSGGRPGEPALGLGEPRAVEVNYNITNYGMIWGRGGAQEFAEVLHRNNVQDLRREASF
jgi:tape measure domain-containing protein